MNLEEQLVLNLYESELRGSALAELSKEIVAVYPAVMSPKTLTASASSFACRALALLQTRIPFVQAEIPKYLYSFLDCANEGKAFESLRITSLSVLGALVKACVVDFISFLLRSEVIPLCLRILEMGSELSKIVATFIIEKILMDDVGLTYVCASVDRFFHLTNVFATMVAALMTKPSTKLLKHVIRCYLRLIDDPRALTALQNNFPEALKDGTFDNCLSGDAEAVQWLQQLLDRLRGGGTEGAYVRGPVVPAEGGSARGGAPLPPVPGEAAGGSSSRGAYVPNEAWKWEG